MPPKSSGKSPYTIFNHWLHDGSLKTDIPKEIVDLKSFSHTYLLYYFQSSPYIVYLNEHFNNFGFYTMDRLEAFRFMKECVYKSGYKPPFIKRRSASKEKLSKYLKGKFPYLKRYEVDQLCKIVDKSPNADSIYEMAGLKIPSKKKLTKKEQKDINKVKTTKKEVVTANNLMEGFAD